MFTRRLLCVAIGLGYFACALGQQSTAPGPGTPSSPTSANASGLEFPIVLHQKLVAGKTPSGTRVEGNVVVATLVNGRVIPRNAIFSGAVIESKAKTSVEPSRLSIRMDSAQWKDGSATIRVYLTSMYYPVSLESGPNLQYGPEQPAKRVWNGMGQYPDNSPTYKPFPAGADTKDPSPNNPSPRTSQRPVSMKDVECRRDSAGEITLLGKGNNIKLDKLTTYIFASSDLAVPNAK